MHMANCIRSGYIKIVQMPGKGNKRSCFCTLSSLLADLPRLLQNLLKVRTQEYHGQHMYTYYGLHMFS